MQVGVYYGMSLKTLLFDSGVGEAALGGLEILEQPN